MGWLTYRISGSPWLLGVVRVRGQHLHPAAWPVAGVLADRVDRRRGLYATQDAARAAGDRPRARHRARCREVWHLVALAVWLGLVSAFDVPLRQTLYVHLVDDRADLPNAIALNSFMVNAARVIGPAIAGVLLAVVSEAVCFALKRVVVRRRARRARQRALAAAGGRARIGRLARQLARGCALRVRLPAGALGIAAGRRRVLDDHALFDADAGRGKDIYGGGPRTLGVLLAAAGAGALRVDHLSRAAGDDRRSRRVTAMAAIGSGLGLAAFAYLRCCLLPWRCRRRSAARCWFDAAAGSRPRRRSVISATARGARAGRRTRQARARCRRGHRGDSPETDDRPPAARDRWSTRARRRRPPPAGRRACADPPP